MDIIHHVPSYTDVGKRSWQSRIRVIYRATKQHALNLAKFVSLYKIFLLLQKKANGGKERSADTFIAGLLGGYVVFGNRTAVNEQASYICSLRSRPLLTSFRSYSMLYPASWPHSFHERVPRIHLRRYPLQGQSPGQYHRIPSTSHYSLRCRGEA